jgi:hypothetical protein
MSLRDYPEAVFWSNDQIAAWRQEMWEALQPEAFRAWLQQFPPETVIGSAHHVDQCPIHNYLNSVVPHLDPWVGQNAISCRFSRPFVPNCNIMMNGQDSLYYLGKITLGRLGGRDVPPWVSEFIRLIDDKFMNHTEDYKRWCANTLAIDITKHFWPVTAANAIEALDEVLARRKESVNV